MHHSPSSTALPFSITRKEQTTAITKATLAGKKNNKNPQLQANERVTLNDHFPRSASLTFDVGGSLVEDLVSLHGAVGQVQRQGVPANPKRLRREGVALHGLRGRGRHWGRGRGRGEAVRCYAGSKGKESRDFFVFFCFDSRIFFIFFYFLGKYSFWILIFVLSFFMIYWMYQFSQLSKKKIYIYERGSYL